MDCDLSAYYVLYDLTAYESAISEVVGDLGDLHAVDDELARSVQFKSEMKRRRWVDAIAEAKRHCASSAPSSALLEVRPSHSACCVVRTQSVLIAFMIASSSDHHPSSECSSSDQHSSSAFLSASHMLTLEPGRVMGSSRVMNMDRAPVARKSRADPRAPTSRRCARRRPRRNLATSRPCSWPQLNRKLRAPPPSGRGCVDMNSATIA
jgi:hypothetical protein